MDAPHSPDLHPEQDIKEHQKGKKNKKKKHLFVALVVQNALQMFLVAAVGPK